MNKACKASTHSATATRLVALLLVICLAECVTGSCLSYGHSCWGAHGKRSDKLPAAAPDWYITRVLRRMAANAEMNRIKPEETKYADLNSIFQLEAADDTPASDRLLAIRGERPVEIPFNKNIEAKPMLDDDVLTKMKIWQMMRGVPEDN